MEFGDRLKLLREETGLSREDLAISLNITYSALSKYETNSRFPDKDTLKKISKYFNVSLDYLMGLTETRNPYENEHLETTSEATTRIKTLDDDLIDLMIKYGIVKDRNNVNEKHYQLIKSAIEIFKDEQNNK